MSVDVTGLARQGGVAASAVEQELQRYIRDKGVNELFIAITERSAARAAAPHARRGRPRQRQCGRRSGLH